MSKQLLIYQLYGPMVSWGQIAVGEVRSSFSSPSRSAIVGMLAAALGIKREQEEQLSALEQALRLAVRVTHPGHIALDYHTAQTPQGNKGRELPARRDELRQEKLNTVLSTRAYLCDARAEVAIWLADEAAAGPYSLAQLREALLKPRFTLYLGRKSCPPALPLEPQLIEAASILEAFEQAEFNSASHLLETLNRSKPASPDELRWDKPFNAAEQALFEGVTAVMEVTRRDKALSRQRWQFANRVECVGVWPVSTSSNT